MDFELDEQQRTLRDEARRFLEAEAPISYARSLLEDEAPYDPKIHAKMAELGWCALPMPEEHEGLGMGFISLALLLVEMGRVVLPGPYFATVALAGLTAADAGAADTSRAIATGETTAALVVDGVEVANGRARGEARFVIDGASADVVLVLQADELFRVEPSARTSVATMDATRRVAHLSFDAAAEPLGRVAAQRVRDRAAVALAAEMLGGAERVLEISVDYAKERDQFGRPIGSFQAVKHRAADMAVQVESLRNAVYYAAWAIERDDPEAPLAASLAKAYASDAYRRVAQSGIQIHGGIGFTWEHDAHLFYKRALFDQHAFGDAAFHQERIASLLAARAAR